MRRTRTVPRAALAVASAGTCLLLAACSSPHGEADAAWTLRAPVDADAPSAPLPPGATAADGGAGVPSATSTATAHGADDPVPGAEASADDFVAWAERHAPSLRAAHARWQAAAEAAEARGALPDPRLRVGYMLEHIETRAGPMRGQVGLEQPFPWFGTLDIATRQAALEAEAARETYEASRRSLSERVRAALHELAWLERALAVAQAHRTLVAQWEAVARARYASGSAAQSDVLRAQVELGKLEDRVRTLADLRGPLAARLNAALGRPAGAPIETPARPFPRPGALDEAALSAALSDTSPELRARAHRVAAADAGVELADAAFFPNFSVGVEYTSIGRADTAVEGSGDDAWALTLGLDLPVWRGRYAAGLRRAQAERSATAAETADALLAQQAELATALYALRDADRRLVLYRDGLVPKARQAVASLGAAYGAGDAGLLELVDAERELIEFELAAARAEADRANALVRAETLTGVTLHEEDLP